MDRILRDGENVWCRRSVLATGLLVDGDDYYRALYHAGMRAQSYILLAGWQFDTDACLLRGPEAQAAALPVTLLEYLDALCRRTPSLRVYLLAWDFHAVFALERQWMQDLRFKWMTSDRLQFQFDAHHVEGGAHHQKFAVVDGALSFLGGLDLCDHRWDDRQHKLPNPLRVSRGEPHQPFHDVQAYVVGSDVGQQLAELFVNRWQAAGGEPISLPPVSTSQAERFVDFVPQGAVPLTASQVSLSRTDPYGAPDGATDCREICALQLRAIRKAERLLYIETQYLSSKEIGEALAARLALQQGALEVVLVLNIRGETFKEQVAVGLAQAKILGELRAAVAGTSNKLGVYYTVPETHGGLEPERGTYIHSKLSIVDDRFLTVGSANLTNRSVGVDTELNLSVETLDPNDALATSIGAARASLLAEHLGIPEVEASVSLVDQLDAFARARQGRLRLHPSPNEQERQVLNVIDPQQLPFDPSAPEPSDEDHSIFVGGLGALFTRLAGGRS
jgi:phosphatidylserine/phosphatidylglycerophosphate/cardiolipin synthase-like enzyme